MLVITEFDWFYFRTPFDQIGEEEICSHQIESKIIVHGQMFKLRQFGNVQERFARHCLRFISFKVQTQWRHSRNV